MGFGSDAPQRPALREALRDRHLITFQRSLESLRSSPWLNADCCVFASYTRQLFTQEQVPCWLCWVWEYCCEYQVNPFRSGEQSYISLDTEYSSIKLLTWELGQININNSMYWTLAYWSHNLLTFFKNPLHWRHFVEDAGPAANLVGAGQLQPVIENRKSG